MNYIIIKNGKIVRNNELVQTDLLIGDHKIVDMGANMVRPDTDTAVIDAKGKIVLPGGIDLHRGFTELVQFDQQQLNRLLQSQIITGTTCWFDKVAYAQLDNWKNLTQLHSVVLPDFSAHLQVDARMLVEPQLLFDLKLAHGVNSLLFSCPVNAEFSEEKLFNLLSLAEKLDLVVVVDVQFPHDYGAGNTLDEPENVAAFHLGHIHKWCNMIARTNCKTCFLNIRFTEELKIIEELAKNHDVFAELCLPFTLGSRSNDVNEDQSIAIFSESLSAFEPMETMQFIVDHPWCLIGKPPVDVINQEHIMKGNGMIHPDGFFLLKHFMSVLSSLPLRDPAALPMLLSEILSERPARLFGLYPVKGTIDIGADADLIVWDMQYERNLFVSVPYQQKNGSKQFILKGHADFVFVGGKMAYNGEQFISESIQGKYLYRIE